MIIMLNGSFGVGKTTIAQALVHALPHAMLYDPEEVGIMLRVLTAGVRLPHEETGDFQDIALWPRMTVITAERLYAQYQRPLIVPMTIRQPHYFQEIKAGLARLGPPLYHFCLTASLPTIQQRLLGRGDSVDGWPWRMAQRCVPAFHGPMFEEYIDTEQQSPAMITQTILQRVAG